MIFTKNPVKGKIKTRLAKEIGDELAFKTYMQLLKHTREITSELDFCDCRIFYNEFIPSKDRWSETIYEKGLQGDGDLAQNMNSAFKAAFTDGYKKVVIMSPDCPELTSAKIKQAFTLLNAKDFVITPLRDGGYCILGMKSHEPSLFEGMEFGHPDVFKQTLSRIEKISGNYKVQPETFDVDYAADLTEKLKKLIGLVETNAEDEIPAEEK